MKKLFLLLTIATAGFLSSCEGPVGPQGPQGTNVEAEVFDLQNVNFSFIGGGYQYHYALNPQILASDAVLIYRMSGVIDSSTPIWQPIPRTIYFPSSTNELDYDFDFTKEDFTIYAGGNYDVSTTPSFLQNQTFRIVIIPGYFSRSATAAVNLEDYDAVILYYHIDDSNVRVVN